MHFQNFGEKQIQTLTWWMDEETADCDGIICDGSIRSGKTLAMSVGFVWWAMTMFDGCKFALCGKTIEALRRNVVSLLPQWMEGICEMQERRSDNTLLVRGFGHSNVFHEFGVKDESSYTLIQDMTLAGVLFDEVALMPRSFVEQAMARCSVEGSRFWFNCNPESPGHWFYTEWGQQAERRNMLHLHFTMEDNLALPAKIRKRYEGLYSGVFYDRYIRGLWVAAEGVIYQEFAASLAPGRDDRFRWPDGKPLSPWRVIVGVDFGGNGSKHAFVATGVLPGFAGCAILQSKRCEATTPDALNQEFLYFCGAVFARWKHIEAVYCDSAEQVLIRGIRTAARSTPLAWLAGKIHNAAKTQIVDRIRLTSALMSCGRLWYLPEAATARDALASALWSGKHPGKDERLDDGSTDVDTLDAFEYTIERDFKRYLRLGAGA